MARGRKSKRGRVVAVLVLLLLVAALLLAPPIVKRVQRSSYPLTYEPEVQRWAAEYKVDPYLVFAVIRTESGFRPAVESDAGARGLMQMTEDTFDWLKTKIAPEEALDFEDLFRPDVSIRFGTFFLSLCLERYGGDVATAAAAYHSGWGTVDGLLEEEEYTQNGEYLSASPYRQMNHYVDKVTKCYEKYLALYAGDD